MTEWASNLDKLAGVLRQRWPQASDWLRFATTFPAQRERVRRLFVRKCAQFGIDLTDVFGPPPTLEQLGDEGVVVGEVAGGGLLRLTRADLLCGVGYYGGPGSGKTTAGIHLVIETHAVGHGAIIVDIRGDWRATVEALPDALLIPGSEFSFNLFEPPPGVGLKAWMHVIASRLTRDLGLFEAGLAYTINLFTELREAAERAGVLPTIPDYLALLEQQHPTPRSSEEGYLQRVLPRVRMFVDVFGPELLAVQRGFPVIELVEAGHAVILDLRMERAVCDLLVSCLLYKLYFRRLFSADPFHQRPVVVVLDEQRSLLRAQPAEFGVPDRDLFLSRARALGISVWILEQIPSALSAAALNAPRLRLAFNNSGAEVRAQAALLGLTPEQAAEIPKLAPGECIARLAGDRIPHPFRLRIPQPECLR